MEKLQTIRELLQEFEKYGTAKEVINKISDKYKYGKPKKKEYSKDELLQELYKDNEYKTAKDVISYLATLNDDLDEDDYSQQGFLYERLWDICIKFGLVKNIIEFDNTNNNPLLHYNGNANMNAIIKENCKEFKSFFDEYLNSKIQSGNSGGYSDITFRNNTDIVLSSSKYFKNELKKDIKKYELHNLCPIINKNTDNVKIVLFLKNKKAFIDKNKTANKSSQLLTKYINPYGNYENVYDLNDLEFYFAKLKNILNYYNYFKNNIDIKKFKEKYLNHYKKIFEPKFHQHLFINQISKIIGTKQIKEKNILIGAIPRTGKTYILAGSIKKYIADFKQQEYNFIIITPAPTETIPQYKDVFNDYIDFEDINIIEKENKKKHKIGGINLYIYSKQKLDCENKKCDKEDENIINILEKQIFDIIFIDEAHYGMTTDNSKKLLQILNNQKKSFKMFITATYNKPIKEFNIPENHMLFWSLENVIDLIKIANDNDNDKNKKFNLFIENIKNQQYFDISIIDDIIKNTYKDNIEIILNQYKNFPQPYLLTTIWKNTDDIYNEIRLANGLDKHTFTMDSMFNLIETKNKFENENELIELFHYYYGCPRKKYIDENNNKYDINYDIRHKYREYGIIPRIRNVCLNNCRTLQNPLNTFNPTTQLWFLPTNEDKLVNKIPVLLKLLKTNFKKYYNQTLFLVAISAKTKIKLIDNNIQYVEDKDDIIKIENDNKVSNKYLDIVIITGSKFNLGVSFPNVDIVVLFNNSRSADLIYQMMFRSMTDINDNNDCLTDNSFCHKKKYGFIVDLNPQRTIEITNYIKSNIIKPTSNNYDKNETDIRVKYMELLNVDRDFFISKYDDNKNDNKNDIQNYTNEYFKKLALYFNETADNIYNKLKHFTFNIDISYLTKIDTILANVTDNTNKKKTKIMTEGISEIFKIREKLKSEQPLKSDIQLEKEAEKTYNNIEKIKVILCELMVILPIITDMNIKCVLNNTISDIKKELIRTLDIIKSNIKLHDIFIDYINDRCKIHFTLNFNDYYKFFIELINNINNNDKIKNSSYMKEESMKHMKDDNITTSVCQKWMENKLVNPVTRRKITEKSPIYKNLKSKCVKLLSNHQKKGGNGNNSELMNYINDTMNVISTKLNNINNPKELLEFLNANLKPTKEKKEKNGEVFTPIKLIEEMFDKLTEANPNIWSDPNLKWLDPAAGMGNFTIVAYLRLMEGLKTKIPNIEKRRKHILENMLYMVEYDRTNSFMMSKIFCGNTYNLNIFTGSFIDGERYEKEGIDIFSLDETKIKKYKYKNYAEENKKFSRKVNSIGGKFDVIMGNPPFNNEKKSPIYNKFIEQSLELTNKLLYIIPSRWFAGGKGLDKFRIMMLNRTDIVFIKNYEKSDTIFGKDVDIAGGINYFLIDKSYNGLCNFNNFMIKLNKYDILITNKDNYNIIDKITKFENIIKLYRGRYYNIETNDKRLSDIKINSNYIKCYVSQQKGNIKYIDKKYIDKNINKWKVITARANGNSYATFGNMFIGKPNEIHTGSFISFEVNNETEAKSLLSYLQCKFPNFMLSLRKISQDISEQTLKWIPLPPLDKHWTNETIYKYFKLTKNEIKLIEDNIK
jgi:site-specific DNA-methyltransferase (adenine-specific)